MSNKNSKIHIEKIVRNILIVLTFISLICSMFHFAYLFYVGDSINDTYKINEFLNKYDFILLVDNILLYIFAILYIILGVKSKKEVALKISFSIFSIVTTMCLLTLIVNFIAQLFGVF